MNLHQDYTSQTIELTPDYEGEVTLEDSMLSAPPKVPVDDVLDAAAALWSARRISSGEATVYGPAGRDDEGFAMGIRI